MTDETLKPCPFCDGPVAVVAFAFGARNSQIECRKCGVIMSGPGLVADLRDLWNARADASTAQSGETEADAPETETKWGIYDTHNEEVVAVYDTEAEARVGPLDPRERIVEIRFPKPPRKRVVYVNVYAPHFRDASLINVGRVYESRAEADAGAVCDRLGCKRIELVEGQYDE